VLFKEECVIREKCGFLEKKNLFWERRKVGFERTSIGVVIFLDI